MAFDRISCDPARMNGQPCIRDLRLTVRRVLEAMAAASSAMPILCTSRRSCSRRAKRRIRGWC